MNQDRSRVPKFLTAVFVIGALFAALPQVTNIGDSDSLIEAATRTSVDAPAPTSETETVPNVISTGLTLSPPAAVEAVSEVSRDEIAFLDSSGSIWFYQPDADPIRSRIWTANTNGLPAATDLAVAESNRVVLIGEDQSVWSYDTTAEQTRRLLLPASSLTLSVSATGPDSFARLNQAGSVWLHTTDADDNPVEIWAPADGIPPATSVATGARSVALIDNLGSVWLYNPDATPLVQKVWNADGAGERTAATAVTVTRSDSLALIDSDGSIWLYNPSNARGPVRVWNATSDTAGAATTITTTGSDHLAFIDDTGSIWMYERNADQTLRRVWTANSGNLSPASAVAATGPGSVALIDESGAIWLYDAEAESPRQRVWAPNSGTLTAAVTVASVPSS